MMASMADNGLVLSGYQKKLKTMKKKFFVLYRETMNTAARLEYYDTEKKFLQRAEPKRVIYIKSCFNINRRLDTKHKFVLALSSREGGFGIVLNSETDLRKWLDNLLSIQRDNANRTDQVYTPYEYVWQVLVQKKGMSESVGISGSYHCCLTSKSLTFICIGPEKMPNGDDRIIKVEILLTTIRRCGHASPQSIFYMELGRQSVLGSGELWMETEDAGIARNMHDMILSAMSAKSESNMNLLNAYKGKMDLSNEPMRKRSSSANEASKPIDVLQRRQNPIEIRSSFSPQYNSYGRERCDSLPNRNRTLSECSNQAYIAVKHGHRCNTISGTRPYSNQRHSDSPPMHTPMKCSESEESSISVDESDDKGTFDTYRIHSRTSKCIIPEENLDDMNAFDNRKSAQLNENFENYISMTPMKSTCENMNANHLNPSTGSNTLLSVAGVDLNFDFPEHSTENLGKDPNFENQYERPSRAYSIGSKVEHTKMTKLLGNLNEVDNTSPRVRAYSVGSQSKIPRCDIQRGVLFSKVKRGQNHKGSNCNISKDVHACSEVVGINTPREMKSTSAPLLNLRNYMNTDRMSDLMEIDFSNSTITSNISPRQQVLNKFEIPSSLQSVTLTQSNNAPNSCSNGNIKQTEMLKQDELPVKDKIPMSAESADSGYLEMKPVGLAHSNYKQISLDDQMEKLRLQNTSGYKLPAHENEPKKDSNFCYAISKTSPTLALSAAKPNRRSVTSADSAKSKHITNLNINNTENHNSLQPKNEGYTKLENNSMSNFALDISSAATVGRKLIHSISNEDYTKHINKSNDAADTKDVGYQILQIKSDSSLDSKKNKNQRPICKTQFLQEAANNVNEKVSKTLSTTKCNLSLRKTETKIVNDDSIVLTNDENASSSSCEHEIHYASLDLPQCSGQNPTKCPINVSSESPPVAVYNSSYAKIDFDQSDSSSASSKIFNV